MNVTKISCDKQGRGRPQEMRTQRAVQESQRGQQTSVYVDPLRVALTWICPTLPHAGWATLFPEAGTMCLA